MIVGGRFTHGNGLHAALHYAHADECGEKPDDERHTEPCNTEIAARSDGLIIIVIVVSVGLPVPFVKI